MPIPAPLAIGLVGQLFHHDLLGVFSPNGRCENKLLGKPINRPPLGAHPIMGDPFGPSDPALRCLLIPAHPLLDGLDSALHILTPTAAPILASRREKLGYWARQGDHGLGAGQLFALHGLGGVGMDIQIVGPECAMAYAIAIRLDRHPRNRLAQCHCHDAMRGLVYSD